MTQLAKITNIDIFAWLLLFIGIVIFLASLGIVLNIIREIVNQKLGFIISILLIIISISILYKPPPKYVDIVHDFGGFITYETNLASEKDKNPVFLEHIPLNKNISFPLKINKLEISFLAAAYSDGRINGGLDFLVTTASDKLIEKQFQMKKQVDWQTWPYNEHLSKFPQNDSPEEMVINDIVKSLKIAVNIGDHAIVIRGLTVRAETKRESRLITYIFN
jgi:hypothetical protein